MIVVCIYSALALVELMQADHMEEVLAGDTLLGYLMRVAWSDFAGLVVLKPYLMSLYTSQRCGIRFDVGAVAKIITANSLQAAVKRWLSCLDSAKQAGILIQDSKNSFNG